MDLGDRKLRKLANSKWIGGVCGGIAYCLGIPIWLTRVSVAILAFGSGPVTIIPYILLWIFLPRWDTDPADLHRVTGD